MTLPRVYVADCPFGLHSTLLLGCNQKDEIRTKVLSLGLPTKWLWQIHFVATPPDLCRYIYMSGYGYRHYHRHPLAVVRFKLHPWHSRHFYYFVIAIMKLKKASSYSHGTAEPRKNIHSKFVVERRHALTTKTPNAASSPIRLLFIGLLCRTQSLSVRSMIGWIPPCPDLVRFSLKL